jgi:hypothetical protein
MARQSPRDAIATAICRANAFASSPPPQYWLWSDAGPSYCYPCVRIARAKELGLACVPDAQPAYARTDEEEAFVEGIDGGDWYSAIEDGPQACSLCGATLKYRLTEHGAYAEIDHYLGNPMRPRHLKNADAAFEFVEALEGALWVEGASRDAAKVARAFLRRIARSHMKTGAAT